MIVLMSAEEMANIPTLVLPPDADKTAPASGGTSCSEGGGRCVAFRPDPQASGNLQVDPDILLPSPGMAVDIALYYNSNTWRTAPFANGPYGYCRSMSPSAVATLYNSSNSVIIQRGNGSIVSYAHTGSGFVPSTPGVLNSLVLDTADGIIKETTPGGIVTAYPWMPPATRRQLAGWRTRAETGTPTPMPPGYYLPSRMAQEDSSASPIPVVCCTASRIGRGGAPPLLSIP